MNVCFLSTLIYFKPAERPSNIIASILYCITLLNEIRKYDLLILLNFLNLLIQFTANWVTAQINGFHYPFLDFHAHAIEATENDHPILYVDLNLIMLITHSYQESITPNGSKK